jgi:hypothetical protein
MTLALQKKRVNADADEGDRQGRCEVNPQMRDLQGPCDPTPERFASRTLDGSSELADIVPDACKR